MKNLLAAMLAVASCAALAQARNQAPVQTVPTTPVYTLDQALHDAGAASPAVEEAEAALDAARAARRVALLRPNPELQGQVENVLGSGTYRGIASAETTLVLALPIELGGKRGARVAVADAHISRATLQEAVAAADTRFQVTSLYIDAVSAQDRLAVVRDHARIAADALHAARVRVDVGRASPIEQQRAEAVRMTAEANVERAAQLAQAAWINLSRRTGRKVGGTLERQRFDHVEPSVIGPVLPRTAAGTLALAMAAADVAVGDANVRLAKANRVPDLRVGPGVRHLAATGDTAAVVAVSIAVPLFNNGEAAVTQARANLTRADAQRRHAILDAEQAITDAEAEEAGAAIVARASSGTAFDVAREGIRLARIAYREGKIGQLDLLEIERAAADTRLAAIDALANYHKAHARLERLVAPAPDQGVAQ